MKSKLIFLNLCIIFVCCLLGNSLFAQSKCTESKVGKTYYSICSENIVTEKKKVLLKTKAVAKKIDNKNTVKIVHYYIADRKTRATDEIFLEYAKFLNNLETHTLILNGSEFTGVLKIAVGFKNEGESAYSGYDLLSYQFKEGEFISKNKLEDVELEKEKKVVR